MNILLSVHHFLDRNAGAPGVTWQLAEQYQELGHQVDIFSYDRLPGEMPDMLVNLLFPQYLHAYCRKLQKQGGLDVIDASSGDIWFHLMMRGKRDGTTVITRSHGLEHMAHETLMRRVDKGEMKLSWRYPLYHGGYRLWEVARSFGQADGAVFLNRHEHLFAAGKFGLQAAEIIGNGLPGYLLDLPLEATPHEGETVRIAMIGSYIPRKGIEFAAKGLSEVLGKHPQAEVTFLGTLCPRERVWQDFDSSLHSRIEVIPQFEHSDLPRLLQGHHIKLFPSLSEGFGMAMVEAMACGLAPVTTRIPGPGDIVADQYDGLTIPPGSPEAIAAALDLLLADRKKLDFLRRQARQTAQGYSWTHIAEKTLAFYEQCAKQKQAAKKLKATG